MMKDKVLTYFKENKFLIRKLTVFLIIFSILLFSVYIITGYTCPDGLCEGLTYDENADWHLQCGRWFVRYLNLLIGNNVVIPLFVVLGYAFCVVCISLVLKELLSFESNVPVYVMGAVLLASPSVISQITFPYIFISYGAAFLFAILYAFFVWNKKWVMCIPATICITLMMGLYQAYVSAAAMIILILIIKDVLSGRKIGLILKDAIKAVIVAAMGSLVDILIYTCELKVRGLSESVRVADSTVSKMFEFFFDSVKGTYIYFFDYYFSDARMGRSIIFSILFLLLALGFCWCAAKIIKSEKSKGIGKVILLIFAVSLLPVAANLILIFVPDNNVTLPMQSHYALVFCLLFVFYRFIDFKVKLFNCIIAGVLGILTYTFFIASNATQLAMKESYQTIYAQTALILEDVYDLEGYIPNETPIVFVGYPSEEYVQNRLPVYEQAIGLNDNQAFWKGENGEIVCRHKYIMNYFGINAGFFTADEFYEATESPEFLDMPIWPAKGSVAFIGDKVVVKLTDDDYPRRG